MNWQLFWTVFGAIFLAELGDKTQLAVLNFTSSSEAPATVFAAASLGLAAVTLVGVLAGGLISRYVPGKWIQIGAGALFIAIGVWTLFKGD